MNEEQLKILCDPTRLKILGLLVERPLTNTELHNKLKVQGIVYRESVFKALNKLRKVGLVEREFHEKVGYKYNLGFEQLEISKQLKITKE